MAKITVSLSNLRFFANHGVFTEEEILGNEFEVNVSMKIKAPAAKVSDINQTINYAEVYRIAKEVFSKREPLLETIAMSIAEILKESFPHLRSISIQICKLHPPITAFTGSVSVTYQKKYKD